MRKKIKIEPKKTKKKSKPLKSKRKKPIKPKKSKPGPNGKINKKQLLLIEIYCNINNVEDDNFKKLIAFLEAGYIGNKEKCLDIFNQPKIIKGIEIQIEKNKKTRIETLEIPDPELLMIRYKEKTGLQGRFSMLTEERMKKIEKLAKLGYTNKRIAQGVSITPGTFKSWLQKAKKAIDNKDFDLDGLNGGYISFSLRLQDAREEFEDKAVKTLIERGYGYKEKKVTIEKKGEKVVSKKIEDINKVDSGLLKWLLERREPESYSKYVIDSRLVNAGNDGIDVEKENRDMLEAFGMLTKTIERPKEDDVDNDVENNDNEEKEE